MVTNTHLEQVDHRFLVSSVSGHSFMEYDQDFGIIEKVKRTSSGVYVPDHWMEMVKKSSRKFMVCKMQSEDFVSLEVLQPYFKSSVTGIRSMQWLHFEKTSPFSLEYKQTTYQKVYMKSSRCGRNVTKLPVLCAVPGKFNPIKYKNLMELLLYVPPVHHDFFTSLKVEGTTRESNDTADIDPEDESFEL